jgi:hypothetical protein
MNIERPTSSVEWEKMKKQTYDLEENLLIIAGGGISVYFSLQPKWLTWQVSKRLTKNRNSR